LRFGRRVKPAVRISSQGALRDWLKLGLGQIARHIHGNGLRLRSRLAILHLDVIGWWDCNKELEGAL
jgi:hypothetical protein